MILPHHTSRSLRTILPVPLAALALLLLLVGVSSAAPADLPQTISHDQIVAAIIAQVTTPTLSYELAGLTGERPVTVTGISYTIATRNSYQTQPISMATRYAYEQFAGLGLDATFHDYTWNGNHWRNVVAEKPGLLDPDEIYLITAHIDDMPSGSPAPGADDNGSGSIAVLMAAKLLAHRYFAYTVRFVLFTGEEQGMRGSAAYAADCAAAGDNILGVVNLDMIAYNSDAASIIDLYACDNVPDSLELTQVFSDIVGIYNLNLIPNRFNVCTGSPIRYSDQWSFLEEGYPAFLAIEDMNDFTPHYHTTDDTLSTLDLDYYADATRAAIATLAHLGRLLPTSGLGQISGTVTDLDTGHPLSDATIAAFWPIYPHTFTTLTDGSGAYTLSLPVDTYTVTLSPHLGYYPATITGVVIITGTVTPQDFTLELWPRWYLPLIAHEP